MERSVPQRSEVPVLPLHAKYNYRAQWCFVQRSEGHIYSGAQSCGIATARSAGDRGIARLPPAQLPLDMLLSF